MKLSDGGGEQLDVREDVAQAPIPEALSDSSKFTLYLILQDWPRVRTGRSGAYKKIVGKGIPHFSVSMDLPPEEARIVRDILEKGDIGMAVFQIEDADGEQCLRSILAG